MPADRRAPLPHRPDAYARPRAMPPAGRWRSFVHRYGWRAYALPILSVITVGAIVHGPHAASATAKHTTARPDTARTTAPASKPSDTVEGYSAADDNYRVGSTHKAQTVSLGNDDPTSCAGNTEPKRIIVSISRQHLWACDAHQQVNETAVTTGSVTNNDQTPLGSWTVQAKQRDRYLVGPGYRDYVQYWMPFNGDFGLHDASWQTMPFGSAQWRTQGSHGCVHTPTPKMAWIYRWAQVGSTVVSIER